MTLTEPSNVENVITIFTYNGYTGSWFPESGRGFARNSMTKPDLAVPGVDVSTALGSRTGSSLAAALCAGCVAQFMEWAIVEGNAPLVDSRGIKSYLIRGAVRENNVVYPDRRWDFGKLNISGTDKGYFILKFHILLPIFAGRQTGFLLKGRRKVASGAE